MNQRPPTSKTLTLIAMGSRGDVQPLVALGLGLRRAGCDVRLATSRDFAALVTGHGLACHPIDVDFRALWQGDLAADLLGGDPRDVPSALRALAAAFGPLMDQIGRDIWDACQGADAVVNQLPLGLFGRDAARVLGVPYFGAAVIPLGRTRAFPSVFIPPVVPGWLPSTVKGPLHLLTHHGIVAASEQLFRRPVDRWRREVLGVGPAPPSTYAAHMAGRTSDPVLYGVSPRVLVRPPDWGPHAHIGGYWFLDDGADYQPPAELAAFLEDGPPPVLISFGSMVDRESEALTALVLDALRNTHLRGLIVSAWGGLAASDLPADVWAVESCPFDWLLCRGWRPSCITAAPARPGPDCAPGFPRWWCPSARIRSTGGGGWRTWGPGCRRSRAAS